MSTRTIINSILEDRQGSDDKWQKNVPLEGVKLGTFARKRQKGHWMFKQYSYEAATEMVEDYLTKEEGLQYSKEEYMRLLPATTCDKKQVLATGLQFAEIGLDIKYTGDQTTHIPRVHLTITKINRRSLEKCLKLRKLDMTSSYISWMKNQKCTPCIVSGIVEAEVAGIASSEGTRDVNMDLSTKPVTATAGIGMRVYQETEGHVKGPILFKVLPLEVDSDGHIEVKEDSKGFITNMDMARPLAGNIPRSIQAVPMMIKMDEDSGSDNNIPINDLMFESRFHEIEELLQPIMENETVAAAFQYISSEDLHYLYRLFEKVQDCQNDVDEPDTMSKKCREILLFSNFQHQEPSNLVLKKQLQSDKHFKGCYYLTTVLEEVSTSTRGLFGQIPVNLFPMLKKILFGEPLDELAVDEILKSEEAMILLEILGVQAKDSASFDATSCSREMVEEMVWVAMLYGTVVRSEQK